MTEAATYAAEVMTIVARRDWRAHNVSAASGRGLRLPDARAHAADNFIKPYFIGRGSDLPFVLVFLGVLGGAIAFGLLGIFLGPTLLAVGYSIVRDWTRVDLPSSSSTPSAG